MSLWHRPHPAGAKGEAVKEAFLQAVTCDLRHKDALESGVAGGKGAPSVKTPGIEASHLEDKPGDPKG